MSEREQSKVSERENASEASEELMKSYRKVSDDFNFGQFVNLDCDLKFKFLDEPDLCRGGAVSEVEVSTDYSPMNNSPLGSSETSRKCSLLKEVENSNFFAEQFLKKNFKREEKFEILENYDKIKIFAKNEENEVEDEKDENSKPAAKLLAVTQFLKTTWRNKIETFRESRKTKIVAKINFLQNSKINCYDLTSVLDNPKKKTKNKNNSNFHHCNIVNFPSFPNEHQNTCRTPKNLNSFNRNSKLKINSSNKNSGNSYSINNPINISGNINHVNNFAYGVGFNPPLNSINMLNIRNYNLDEMHGNFGFPRRAEY